MTAHSADEFYSLMGELSTSIMQGAILDGDAMVKVRTVREINHVLALGRRRGRDRHTDNI